MFIKLEHDEKRFLYVPLSTGLTVTAMTRRRAGEETVRNTQAKTGQQKNNR